MRPTLTALPLLALLALLPAATLRAAALAPAPLAPILEYKGNATIQPAYSIGEYVLSWRSEPLRRYRLEASADLRTWATITERVAIGDTCRIRARPKYTPPWDKPGQPDPEVRKFWRLVPFDVDSDADGISDYDEHRAGTDPFAGTRISLTGPFVPFAMRFAGLTAAKQIKLCQDAGYTGIGLGGPGPLADFIDEPDVVSGKFRVYSMLWYQKVEGAAPAGVDPAVVNPMLAKLRSMNAAFWVVASITKAADTDPVTKAMGAKTEAFYHAIADLCQAAGVQLVLYPHAGCSIESAEEALVMRNRLAALGHPEVKISIHLCHEIVKGNRARLGTVVAAVKDHLALASINGTNATGSDWFACIQTLDSGTYDPRPYLQALAAAGYTGPMEYQTYDLPDPEKDDHLTRALARWRQLVAPPSP